MLLPSLPPPCSPLLRPPQSRFAQTARLAGYASRAVNSAVSGLAYVGAKVAGGGEAPWPHPCWPGEASVGLEGCMRAVPSPARGLPAALWMLRCIDPF